MHVNTGVLARGFAWVVTGPLRYVIVLVWIGAMVAAYHYWPGISGAGGDSVGLLAPKNAAAITAEQRALQLFSYPILSRSVIVQRNPHGLSAAAQKRLVLRAKAIDMHPGHDPSGIAAVLPVVNIRGIVPASRERLTTALTYLYFPPWRGIFDQAKRSIRYAQTHVNRPGDDLVGVTGVIPARYRESGIIANALPPVTLGTVLLIIIVVGITFRALGAPLVTLFASGIAYETAVHVIGYAARRAGIAVPVELEPLLIVLILAVCTDYAVFFLSGTKRCLQAGEPRVAAARATTAEFVPIILTAGLTIVGCTACLAVSNFEFLRALGPALAVGVAMAMLVAITLVPALLAIFGRAVFWPSVCMVDPLVQPVDREGGWRASLAWFLATRRWAALLTAVCLAALGAAASGVRHLGLGLPLLSDLPASTAEARATRAASQGFAPGILSPTMVLLQQRGISGHKPQLVQLENAIGRQRGVAGVVGPREQVSDRAYGVVFSRDGSAARMVVILNSDPLGAQAIARLGALQHRMPQLLRAAGLDGVRVSLAGDTVVAKETIDRIVSSMLPVGIAISLVILVSLVILLRSLIAPLYLLLASVLAALAPLGLTVYLFQQRLGFGYLGYYTALGGGVLLIALGCDYNLFVVGRVWEEGQQRPLREAIAVAVPRATGAISTAAVTLAASFALLAIVPLVSFREFAFVMAAGVLIDAFVVRSYLVLALMALFGRLSMWPRTAPVATSIPPARSQPMDKAVPDQSPGISQAS